MRAPAQILEQMVWTRSWSLGRPERPRAAGPDSVLFLRSGPRDPVRALYEHDVRSGQTRCLLTAERILKGRPEAVSAEEQARRERMRVSGGGFTAFDLSPDGGDVLLSLGGGVYLYERTSGQVSALADPKDGGAIVDPKFSPDGRCVAFVRQHDLCVVDRSTGKETSLTQGGTEEVSFGLAEFVAQEEMGRFTGYWWSPDSAHVLYQETDNRAVERHFIADPSNPGEPPARFFYPRAGTANASVRLGIVPVGGGATRWVHWDRRKHPYLARVQWPRDALPTVQVQSRDQRELLLLELDPASGETRLLMELRDEQWVNLHGDRNEGCHWLPGGAELLWSREEESGWVLELRSREGRLVRTLTRPELGLLRLSGVHEKEGWALVEAGPLPERRLYRVPLDGAEAVPMFSEAPAGTRTAVLDAENELLIVTEATEASMPRTWVCRPSGERLGELPSVAEEVPLAANLELTTAGQLACNVMLVHPHRFDASRRYPVLLSVYGGPHVTKVVRSMASFVHEQWLAEQGFVVVSIDGRGSWGHGRSWERPVHGKLGSVPLADQSETLIALGKERAYLDMERVGIFGWSFGGYLSALAVMERPDVFHAAAAGAPVTDWLDYDTHYTERYMGAPQRAAEAYAAESPLRKAARLSRPLLILHGTADDNVYFSHSLKLADALLRAGRRFELAPLAGQTHRVNDPELFRAQWERIAGFFLEHLGSCESPS
jgi:dipeptidyl-peptidase 4